MAGGLIRNRNPLLPVRRMAGGLIRNRNSLLPVRKMAGVLSQTGTSYLWERWRGSYQKQELLICEKDGGESYQKQEFLILREKLWDSLRFDHCVVSPSTIYGFWLTLWYLLSLGHCVVLLRFTASDYPFGIFKLFFHTIYQHFEIVADSKHTNIYMYK